jgi:hypothetical protein
MLVQFTRRSDGAVIFRCVRNDGSSTWQRHEKHAQFFSFHDLTHFGVETALRFRLGFYGLIAAGWDIDDTTGKGPRGKLPPEAILVEHLVNLFERERSGGALPLSEAGFNEQLTAVLGTGSVPCGRSFTQEELAEVRARIEELHARWAATPAGGTMELRFAIDPALPQKSV